MLDRTPVVSVVMVAFGGGWPWVPRALEALGRNTAEAHEVILVDNGGTDERPLPDSANVEIVRNPENVGFGAGSNQGVARARSEIICLLNTDVLVEPGWLAPLLERIHEHEVGAAFPALLNLDGTMQEAGAFLTGQAHSYVFGAGDDPDSAAYRFSRDVDYGSAACVCMTKHCFESVGGFDPAYRVAYFEDVDLCFRLRNQGLRLVWEPRARVKHARSVSAPPTTLPDSYSANREIFLSRWRPAIEGRPEYELLRDRTRVRLAARDLHAPKRFLLLGAADETCQLAEGMASREPRGRVTLLARDVAQSDEDALLGSGVEVVQTERTLRWLIERRGHYSHVVCPEDELPVLLRAVLRRTQRQAHFMTVEELETSAGALVSPQRPDDLAAKPQRRR